MASARKKSNSRTRSSRKTVASTRADFSARTNRHGRTAKRFAVCVRNDGYKASLELRKIYEVLADAFGEKHNFVRVIDESGEDYLYPSEYFVRVPASLQQKLRDIA
jgi:hypothetical protein